MILSRCYTVQFGQSFFFLYMFRPLLLLTWCSMARCQVHFVALDGRNECATSMWQRDEQRRRIHAALQQTPRRQFLSRARDTTVVSKQSRKQLWVNHNPAQTSRTDCEDAALLRPVSLDQGRDADVDIASAVYREATCGIPFRRYADTANKA